ncbi:Slit 1 protein [Nymphon striatum]|nr:Slit 1 protein [Nymphon striatum]
MYETVESAHDEYLPHWWTVETAEVTPSTGAVCTGPRTRLELINTGLKSIDANAFTGLETSLKILVLRGNVLSEIPSASLISLKRVHTLSLSGNEITEVHNDSFVGMDELKVLSSVLQQNSHNRAWILRELHTIVIILQSADKLARRFPKPSSSSMAFRVRKSSDQLKRPVCSPSTNLILSGNKISSLHSIFKHLTALRSLNLSGNIITQLGTGDLDVIKTLMEVDLSFNLLTKLDKHSFAHLGKTLTKLVLHHNLINSMTKALRHLDVVREIDLEHNNLTTLHTLDPSMYLQNQVVSSQA